MPVDIEPETQLAYGARLTDVVSQTEFHPLSDDGAAIEALADGPR